jgi:uncharacterized membrane protein YoaK (UPF0700 family)
MEPTREQQIADHRKKRRGYLAVLVLVLTFAVGVAFGVGLTKAFIEFSALLGVAIVIVIVVAIVYFVMRRRREEHRAP